MSDRAATLPPSTLASFGPVAFAVRGKSDSLLHGISRSDSVRIEEHQVCGGKPAVEFLAPDLQSLALEITLRHSRDRTVSAALTTLHTLMSSGTVARLVIGGESLGKFLLLKMDEKLRHFGPDGLVISAQVGLEFKEYH